MREYSLTRNKKGQTKVVFTAPMIEYTTIMESEIQSVKQNAIRLWASAKAKAVASWRRRPVTKQMFE